MQELIVRIRDVVSGSDPTVAFVLAGVAILAILLIVGAAVFVVRMYSPRGRLDLLLESRAPESATNPWITRAIVSVTVLLVVVATTLYAERPESCMSCHQDPVYSEALAESVHATVGCASCHRSAGATARVDDAVRYTGWLWSYYLEAVQVEPGTGAFVDSRRCLACHDSVREGVIETDGVRVRHSDFLEEGASCLVCHGDTAHAELRGVQGQPIMNSCMQCHDDEIASAACEECHVSDLGVRAVAKRGGKMDTVGIRETDCYACHAERPCLECHGITMPHPEGFSFPPPAGVVTRQWVPNRVGGGYEPGSHARAGFVNREMCWRCHHAPGRPFEPSDDGCSCHGLFGFMHGGPAWIREHGLQATGQKPGMNAACDGCHGSATIFCTYCHPPSYAERFAPITGPDNYTASPGWPRLDPLDPDW